MFRRTFTVRRVLRMAEEASSAATKATTPGKVLFRFRSPTESLVEKEIDSATVPGLLGDFGVSDGLAPVLSQLRPGVVSVQEENTAALKKWFITGGFAVMQEDNVCAVTVPEAIPLEHIDNGLVSSLLAAQQATASSAADPVAKAEAEIAVEIYEAMKTATA
jgi:F-type H+-transporting ATPase subunit delta